MLQAILFPGQGSQTVGMGKSLYDHFSVARDVFCEVDEALNQHLSAIMFDGPPETLTLTENAQPAIMATSIAALRVLESETGFSAANADFAAGHSLGEYTALAATGALNLTDTARLLKLRGQSMQRAVPKGNGAMAALIGIDYSVAHGIALDASKGEICGIANDNAPGQVVISGARGAIERAIELAKEKGAKRAVLLDVSAPFHCPLMGPAAGVMQEALDVVELAAPCIPIIANMTAKPCDDPATIKRLLVDQVTGMVRWRESMQFLASEGVNKAHEFGEGKVLAGLMKRIAAQITVTNISSAQHVTEQMQEAA